MHWSLRWALVGGSVALAACGDRAGEPGEATLGQRAPLCMSVTQTLTACIVVTRLDAPGRQPGDIAADVQACPRVRASNRLGLAV